MSTNKQSSISTPIIPKPNKFFDFPKGHKKFSDAEWTFLSEAILDDNDYEISTVISDIIDENRNDRARQLYEIANFFRIQVVEGYTPEIDNLTHTPYSEILTEAIYNIDNFKIAEELLTQYEEKIGISKINQQQNRKDNSSLKIKRSSKKSLKKDNKVAVNSRGELTHMKSKIFKVDYQKAKIGGYYLPIDLQPSVEIIIENNLTAEEIKIFIMIYCEQLFLNWKLHQEMESHVDIEFLKDQAVYSAIQKIKEIKEGRKYDSFEFQKKIERHNKLLIDTNWLCFN